MCDNNKHIVERHWVLLTEDDLLRIPTYDLSFVPGPPRRALTCMRVPSRPRSTRPPLAQPPLSAVTSRLLWVNWSLHKEHVINAGLQPL